MCGADAPAVAPVDDRRDLDTDPVEIGRGGVAFGVGGEHDGALAGLDPPQVDQAASRSGGDHPGTVVAREHVGPLDETRRHHQHLGPGLDESLHRDRVVALHDAEPVVLVAARDGGVGQHLDIGGVEGGPQLGQGGVVRLRALL